MEMERINDNTIRVMIENTDLKERGISVMELLGDHDKIESFFYNILSEVDVDHDFSDDDQVSFQILPNRNGLELFISRLDSENQVGDVINNLMNYTKNKSESTDKISDERRTELQQNDDGVLVDDSSTNTSSGETVQSLNTDSEVTIVLKLVNFDSIISIAKMIQTDNVISNLYRYESVFYLTLIFPTDSMTKDMIKNKIAVAIEFAEESNMASEVLREHADSIMETDALEQINKIF